MPNDKFKVLVIIPTYNRGQCPAYFVQSLIGQTPDPPEFEIVIADDGYRTAPARNLGVRIANGNICLFTDSGIVVKSDCLAQHVNCHRSIPKEIAIVGYPYGYAQHGESEEELMGIINPADADGSIAARAEKKRCWGGHLSVKRKRLLEIGRYDGNRGRGQ